MSEIVNTYTESDVAHAPSGHLPFVGSDVEVVAFRTGDDLVLIVNKAVCVFRTVLVGAFRDDLDLIDCNMLMRDERNALGQLTAERQVGVARALAGMRAAVKRIERE